MRSEFFQTQQQREGRRKIIWRMPKIIYFNSSCSHCEATITCLSGFFYVPRLLVEASFFCMKVIAALFEIICYQWLWCRLIAASPRLSNAFVLRNASESGLTRWRLAGQWASQGERSTLRAEIKRCNLILGMSQQSFYGFFWNLQFSRSKSRS